MTGVQTCALPICFPVTIGNSTVSFASYVASNFALVGSATATFNAQAAILTEMVVSGGSTVSISGRALYDLKFSIESESHVLWYTTLYQQIRPDTGADFYLDIEPGVLE